MARRVGSCTPGFSATRKPRPALRLTLILLWLAVIGLLSAQPPFAILATYPGLDKVAHR